MINKNKLTIGFVGQGFIGKSYADDFEKRGFRVVRYSLEKAYKDNKDKIKECDIVFIAVPTPTTPKGFVGSIVEEAVKLVGMGKTAVIKSTIIPTLTEKIQKKNPGIFVLHSPEFLTAKNAAYDAAHPDRNIVGMPKNTPAMKKKAQEVIEILPKAPFNLICASRESELIKYGGNNWFYFKVVYVNMLYDLSRYYGISWDVVREGMAHDPRIGTTHLDPMHQSGRGAGGPCFIKDFAAFKSLYDKNVGDKLGKAVLRDVENKNIDLLLKSKKDLDLLFGVYGNKKIHKKK